MFELPPAIREAIQRAREISDRVPRFEASEEFGELARNALLAAMAGRDQEGDAEAGDKEEESAAVSAMVAATTAMRAVGLSAEDQEDYVVKIAVCEAFAAIRRSELEAQREFAASVAPRRAYGPSLDALHIVGTAFSIVTGLIITDADDQVHPYSVLGGKLVSLIAACDALNKAGEAELAAEDGIFMGDLQGAQVAERIRRLAAESDDQE